MEPIKFEDFEKMVDKKWEEAKDGSPIATNKFGFIVLLDLVNELRAQVKDPNGNANR